MLSVLPQKLRGGNGTTRRAPGCPCGPIPPARHQGVVVGSDVRNRGASVIHPGGAIADEAVADANAAVTRDAGAHEIAAGAPERLMGRRFDTALSDRLLASRWWISPGS